LSSFHNAPDGVAGAEFGYAFLEKFIQIPFLIPRPTEIDVNRLLDSFTAAPQLPSVPIIDIDPGIRVQVSADSDTVRNVVTMVAPALDHNPRRVKQFLNLFRLRALLASQTGLFGEPRDPKQFDRLTLEQLGKLVAITLRWPRLLWDLEERMPTLLSELQLEVWGRNWLPPPDDPRDAPPGISEAEGRIVRFWCQNNDLRRLIAFPEGTGDPWIRLDGMKYGLHRVDVDRFLQVAPLVAGRDVADTPQDATKANTLAVHASDTVQTRDATVGVTGFGLKINPPNGDDATPSSIPDHR
jgi:hypothetical protein